MVETALRFLDFELLPGRQLLLRGGSRVQVGARALDLLDSLARRPGEVVSKAELLKEVWPNLTMEETSLRTLVRTLRKALGDGQDGARYIVSVPGRGYRFTPDVALDQPVRPLPLAAPTPSHNLPARLSRVFGRRDVIAALTSRMEEARLLTILGPGGIGKTTVAIECARTSLDSFADGVLVVDLASTRQDHMVARTIAAALNLPGTSVDPTGSISSLLRSKRLLLVLDSCEPVIAGAATFAESLLRAAPRVCLLATSREPLRIDGEHRYRLPTLDVAPLGFSAQDTHLYPAVELFCDRAKASSPGFELTAENAADVAELCRRLDGLPLAIELAAARVDTLGVLGILARLKDRFSLLMEGRRTALPRQQTLRATLDWSYDLLERTNQLVFRGLGTFEASFTLEAATALFSEVGLSSSTVAQAIDELAEKSLVVTERGNGAVLYRLLDSSRAYAIEALERAEGRRGVSLSLARFYCQQFADADAILASAGWSEWVTKNEHTLPDLRALLLWAFDTGGDPALGVELATASIPLWWELALLDEQRDLVARALSLLPSCRARIPDPLRAEMQLSNALGYATFYTRGLVPEVQQSFAGALAIAESRSDVPAQRRALWGSFGVNKVAGDYGAALRDAERYLSTLETAARDGAAAIGNRMMGMALHYEGRHTEAQVYLSKILSQPPQATPVRRAAFQYDDRVTAGAQHARLLWIQGFVEQARSTAEDSLARAEALTHELSLCFVLAFGVCPVAAWSGDVLALQARTQALMRIADEFSFHYWGSWGRCFEAALRQSGGEPVAPEALHALAATPLHVDMLSSLHSAFVLPEAVERTDRGLNGWCAAEVLRCRGERLAGIGRSDADEKAEGEFRASMALAKEQRALSWELRATTSFARFTMDRRRRREGAEVLSSVLDRFTEGFETPDLLAALELVR